MRSLSGACPWRRLCRFFFQAEDGIRDTSVTGVQTCALPIWLRRKGRNGLGRLRRHRGQQLGGRGRVVDGLLDQPAQFRGVGWRDAVKILELANQDRKSTRLNSSHRCISYAVFCLKKKKTK